jgi:ABC-type branched-subunit amino acid transport system ATPase component
MENVSKKFGGPNALTEVSLSVEQSRIMGLVGPNGGVKTRLFNVAISIYKPDSGDIYLKGKRITGNSPQQVLTMRVRQRSLRKQQKVISMSKGDSL